MNIVNFFNYILGYVEFDIIGTQLERFISSVMRENVDVWALRKLDACTLRAKARLVDIKQLEVLAHENSVELKSIDKKGVPLFLKKYRYRYGFLAGAVIFVVFLLVMSSFIWSIDVKGESSRLEKEQVLQLLDESGFKVGAPVFLQDYQSLKLMLMREFDNFAFVTINVLGSKAEVEITQRDMPPEIIPSHVPCNIIAAEDGQIVTYETYNGIPQYKTGDAVKKGELLVSGVYDSKVIGYRLVHSNAKIMARTLKKINTFVPYQKTETSDTGNEKSFYYFTAFNKTFNLTFSPASPFENFRTETTQDDLSIGDNMVLPLSLGKVSYIEQKDKEKFLTDEEAETEAKRYLDELERLEIHDLIVENKDVNVIKTENGIFCEYVYTIIKDIAQKQEIYKNETS